MASRVILEQLHNKPIKTKSNYNFDFAGFASYEDLDISLCKADFLEPDYQPLSPKDFPTIIFGSCPRHNIDELKSHHPDASLLVKILVNHSLKDFVAACVREPHLLTAKAINNLFEIAIKLGKIAVINYLCFIARPGEINFHAHLVNAIVLDQNKIVERISWEIRIPLRKDDPYEPQLRDLINKTKKCKIFFKHHHYFFNEQKTVQDVTQFLKLNYFAVFWQSHQGETSLHQQVRKKNFHLVHRLTFEIDRRKRFRPEGTALKSADHQLTALQYSAHFGCYETLQYLLTVYDAKPNLDWSNNHNIWLMLLTNLDKNKTESDVIKCLAVLKENFNVSMDGAYGFCKQKNYKEVLGYLDKTFTAVPAPPEQERSSCRI